MDWQGRCKAEMARPVATPSPIKGKMMNKQIGGNHYLKDIQPWDAMKSWWGSEAFSKYCMMTSIKYIMRQKNDKVEDLQKAIHYLEAAIDEIKNAGT